MVARWTSSQSFAVGNLASEDRINHRRIPMTGGLLEREISKPRLFKPPEPDDGMVNAVKIGFVAALAVCNNVRVAALRFVSIFDSKSNSGKRLSKFCSPWMSLDLRNTGRRHVLQSFDQFIPDATRLLKDVHSETHNRSLQNEP